MTAVRIVPYALAAVIAMAAVMPAFADHAEVTVVPVAGSGVFGNCEGVSPSCYTPYEATVDVGGKVIFSNTDTAKHTFTSGMIEDDEAGLVFDSKIVQPGESYEWTPEEAGEYPYFCLLHPWASGIITVQEAEAPADPGPVAMPDPGTDDPEPVAPVDPEPDVDPVDPDPEPNQPITGTGGGCLIATAAYGTELAPQVQQLRELRDNVVMGTESGSAFMAGFNDIYYSFSPAVADLQRENPAFRDVTRAALTPMISSLSLLNHAGIDSEAEMAVYGISLILLNIGMYAGLPAFGIIYLYKRR